jgi:hypothetical protein
MTKPAAGFACHGSEGGGSSGGSASEPIISRTACQFT